MVNAVNKGRLVVKFSDYSIDTLIPDPSEFDTSRPLGKSPGRDTSKKK